MRKLMLGSLAALSLFACSSQPAGGTRASGSLATSRDDSLLYAADTDNGVLGVIDLKTRTKLYEVKVGASPWRVTVGADDSVYVANRASRSVSVIRKSERQVSAELATDVDPVGLVVSADGKSLYVVCSAASTAAEYGTLTAFDTQTLQPRWTLKVGEEPRGIALVSPTRAIVSLYHAGEVAQVDLEKGALISGSSDIYASANSSALTTTSNEYSPTITFHPRATGDVIATPNGKRVFISGVLSRETPILTPPTPDTPYYKGQGPRLVGSVTTSAVFTFDTADGAFSPLIDDVSGYGGNATGTADHPQTSYATTGYYSTSDVLQGPTVGVVDGNGDWLFLVNRESSNLAVISATERNAKTNTTTTGSAGYDYYGQNELPSVYGVATIGSGSDGVVVLGDNTRAFVYSQFEHRVYEVGFDSSSHRLVSKGALPGVSVGAETLSGPLAMGRKLFFDANDRRISAKEASVACSSCHLEGRDDGHTWNFPDGPRQTPSLAGRGTLETPPYHWSGEFKTLPEFLKHTVTSRMGGTGLEDGSAVVLNAYVGSIPAPENPYKQAVLSDEQVRGQHVFQVAQCGTCHSGQWFTNNQNADVGTLATRDNGLVVSGGVNIPSLKGLARSGPYLHDGSVLTLSDRILKNPGNQHGVTSNLRPGDVTDLVAYLRSL